MRVLLVHGWHPVEGGTELYVSWIRRALTEAGDDVRLLVSDVGSAAGGTADYVARGSRHPAAQAFLQIANPWASSTVRRAVREFRPDVALVCVFANFLSPAVFGPLEGVPTVLAVTDYKLVCPLATKLLPDGSVCHLRHGSVCLTEGCTGFPHWLRDRIRYRFIARALGRADAVVSCSAHVQEVLATDEIDATHLVWPVPDPSPDFSRTPSSRPRFLFAGRLVREKGVFEMMEAFDLVGADVPDATLVVAGDGPAGPSLRAMADRSSAKGRIDFPGWVDAGRMEEEYARAWALVVPSVWPEPLGMVAIEAIVRGVPVIATDAGGLRETGVPEAGRLVPRGDVGALAEAMEDVATGRAFPDRTVRDDIRRAVALRHDLGTHVEALRKVFRSVVS